MTFDFKSDPSNRKVFIQIRNLPEINRRAIRKAFYFVGKDLVSEARSSILRKPKSGRTYVVYKGGRRRLHRSSAPGEAPANLTGDLRRSVDFKVRGGNQMEFGADTPYARRLELGGGNIAARPYLIAAIEKEERNTMSHFRREIEKELKK